MTTVTKHQLCSFLEAVFQEPPGSIDETRTRASIANWDSMGSLLLIADVDERFHVTLADEEIRRMLSIADLFQVLRDKQVAIDDG